MARKYKRYRKRNGRKKKLSSRRYKQWWPDLLYTKLACGERGVLGTPTSPSMCMSNPGDRFGPTDVFSLSSNKAHFLNFLLCPSMYDHQDSTIGYITELSPTPTAALNYPTGYTFPEMRTTGLRYIGYRVMGVYVSLTIRSADDTGNANFAAAPFFVTGVPYQTDDGLKGNYWDGKSVTTRNSVSSTLTYTDIGNLRHGYSKRVKGFGSSSGGERTFRFMFYPWKVYGMTKMQWLNDPKAFREINTSYGAGAKYNPTFTFSVSDYNLSNQRKYSFDYKYIVFIRWEGQKFLLPLQG